MCVYGRAMLLFAVLVLELCFSPATVVAVGFAVNQLPGYEGSLPLQLETGYIGVGLGEADEAVQLFYYFIKSESNPDTDPLILWLTGGPGCSGLWSITYDNGPLRFNKVEYNGSMPTLSLNPYGWTKWLKEHPNFISNDLYVGGESYSGILVPIITRSISDEIEAGVAPWINLKGYLLGNPATVLIEEFNYQIPYAHGMGLISDDLYKSLELHCKGKYQLIEPNNLICLQNVTTFYQWYSQLYEYHILEPACPDNPDASSAKKPQCHFGVTYPKLFDKKRSLGENPLPNNANCRDHWYDLMSYWANEQIVRDVLHIREGTIEHWEFCSSNLSYIYITSDVTPYHAYLSTKGYRSLIYSGDHDPCIPFISTQAWIKSLNYSIVDDWKPWWTDNQIAGYTMTYSNGMTFATVKGAGHTVPESAPYQALNMFTKWIQNGHL